MPPLHLQTRRLVAVAGSLLLLALTALVARGVQTPTGVKITGTVTAGTTALPGAAITITDVASGKKYITSTDENGNFQATVGHAGDFTIGSDFPDFAPATATVTVGTTAPPPVHLNMTLAALAPAPTATTTTTGTPAPKPAASATTTGTTSVASANSGNRSAGGRSGRGGRGSGANAYQSVEVNGASDLEGVDLGADATPPGGETVAGMNTDADTDTMTTLGSADRDENALSANMLQQGLQQIGAGPNGGDFYGDAGPAGGIAAGGSAIGGGGRGGGFAAGGRGGFAGGGRGGFAGGRGGGGGAGGTFALRTNANRFNQPHGNFSYTLSDSALNALPYSLTGVPATNVPNSANQSYTGTVTAPLVIPHIYDDKGKTSYTFSFTGHHNRSLNTLFGIVPTEAERSGDFQGLTNADGSPVTVIDPSTGQPFANDTITPGLISSAATGLLAYIPLPNVPCPAADTAAECQHVQNYTATTQALSSSNQVNLRVNHVFTQPPRGRGARGGGGGGRGGRGGRGTSMNFSLAYTSGNAISPGLFPSQQGTTKTTGLNTTLGFNFPIGGWLDNFNVTFNRSTSETNNLYAYNTNVLGALGIQGLPDSDPQYWGLPTLTFTNFTSLSDTSPGLNHSQTFTTTEGIVRRIGHHTWRIGGDVRRVQNNPEEASNVRGDFTFTGLYSGYDFADFLLGDAQETTARYGGGVFHFRQNYDDLYVQDNWQAARNFTMNWGARWEYVSPMTELNNRLTNLLFGPGFTSITPVTASTPGMPPGMIYPQHDAISPRIGLAWKVRGNFVLGGGYGINYNTQTYNGVAQQLAYQYPFVTNVTNIATTAAPLSLVDGFPTTTPTQIQNTYSINPNMRMGYVQLWDVSVQRQLGRVYLLNLDYNGSKGTDLDQLRAPNRTATGLLFPDVAPFYYDTFGGNSTYNGGSVVFSRRLSHSVSWRFTYTYSKAITDASSLGTSAGAGGVVAQNDLDLDAEKSLAPSDERHRVVGTYEWQLPYGLNHRWGDHQSWFDSAAGDWEVTGSFTFHTGMPLTPIVSNSSTEVFQGITGSLRPNVVPGATIALADPTEGEFFNTAAFTLPPTGTYGDAGRDIITGPASWVLNMALDKSFRVTEFQSLNIRLSANNVLNHPEFSGVNTTINSPLFGQVTSMAAMRSVQLVLRYRF